jgi:hypothetical protein
MLHLSTTVQIGARLRGQPQCKYGKLYQRSEAVLLTVEIGILIGVLGCFVGLAGWLSGRDKRIAGDAEWRGTINAKLDLIAGLSKNVTSLECKLNEHGERITAVAASAEQAHKRIDRIERDGG